MSRSIYQLKCKIANFELLTVLTFYIIKRSLKIRRIDHISSCSSYIDMSWNKIRMLLCHKTIHHLISIEIQIMLSMSFRSFCIRDDFSCGIYNYYLLFRLNIITRLIEHFGIYLINKPWFFWNWFVYDFFI